MARETHGSDALNPPTRPGVAWAVAVALLLQMLGWLVHSNWCWGLSTLAAWNAAGAVALLLVGAAGLLTPLARLIGALLERVGQSLNRGRAGIDAALAVAVAALLFVLRDPFRFTGDSSLRAQTIGYERPPTALFPQALPLDLIVNFHLPRALHQAGLPPEVALQAVGACMGGLFAWAALRMLAASGATGSGRVAGAVVALTGAHLVHFAGYDKFGPVLVGIALAALGAVRLSRGNGGALLLALGITVAVLSHRSGMLIVPPALWIGVRAWRADPSPRSRRALALSALIPAAALAGVVPAALRLFGGIDRQVHMPGGAVQRSLASPDAPALLVRASDFLNGVLLVAPLLPVGMVAALALRSVPGPRPGRFGLAAPLLLAFALQAGLLVAVGATRGSGRDWDVTTPAGTLVVLGTAYALARSGSRDRRALAAAVMCALALGTALFGVHVSEARARRRVELLLDGTPAWSRTARAYAHDFIGLRAFSLQRWDESVVEFEHAIDAAPNPRYFLQLGAAHAAAGRPHAALAPFRSGLALDPTMQEAWFGLANAAWALGDTAQALAVMDSAVAQLPGDPKLAAARRALVELSAPR